MQERTWFGIFTTHEGRIAEVELFQKDTDTIIERLIKEPLLLNGKIAGEDLRDLAVKYGFVRSRDEYDRMFHEINIQLVKKLIAQTVTQERQIIAAVEAIDDIDETTNILAERLKEWYLMNLSDMNLRGIELARHIIEMKESMPAPEFRMMHDLASNLIALYDTRLAIEKYLKESMFRIAPNLTSIAGHILGARLLSIAGSLERLASMPSSTVQVIGANNALFKHLKGKAPSPKHGVIFRHPYVNRAPGWQRGKIARAVASKISHAARYDCYSGELKESLLEELDAKVTDIKKRYTRPGRK